MIISPNTTSSNNNNVYSTKNAPNVLYANVFGGNMGNMNIGNINLNNLNVGSVGSMNYYQDNILSTQKRYRDDNYLNFSPNLNSASMMPQTPLYNSFSPNLPHIFMFNNSGGINSLTATPVPRNTGDNQNNANIDQNNSVNAFDYSFKDETVNETEKSDNKIANVVNNQSNNNESNPQQPVIVNQNPPIEYPNLVLVSTPVGNPNYGFYTWVMQGSPHPSTVNNINNFKKNANNSNLNSQNKKKSIRSNSSKLKKQKYKEEESC